MLNILLKYNNGKGRAVPVTLQKYLESAEHDAEVPILELWTNSYCFDTYVENFC